MRQILRTTGIFIFCVGLLPLTLSGLEQSQGKSKQDKGKGKAKAEKREQHEGHEFSLEFLLEFSTETARRYAVESHLVGSKPLPPGIRKNVARGKPIPPGIAKREIPAEFLKKLPAHEDYEWHMAGTDLLLVAKTDHLIVEIAADVFH